MFRHSLSASEEMFLDMQNTDKDKPIVSSIGEDGVATVVINRPEQRNALSLEALDCLRDVFVKLHDNGSLKCVILTGAGDRSFAAGGDLKELASFRSDEQAAQVSRTGRHALDAIRHCPAPVYAAINGHALGGGAELAMACDFRFAHANATIGFLQGKLNITTSWGGGTDLVAHVGPSRALELMLTSRVMKMDEAQANGLIDRVIPDGVDLLAAVREHAGQFLAKPAHVIQAFTRVVHAAKTPLRKTLEPVEFQSFISTWVHNAHWAAAADSLPKTKS
jgi:enoyl-CoA hydratase